MKKGEDFRVVCANKIINRGSEILALLIGENSLFLLSAVTDIPQCIVLFYILT